jgi:hypothetical protein
MGTDGACGLLFCAAKRKARNLWVVRTLEMHTGRRLTCGARSSIAAEANNGLSTDMAPCALPPGQGEGPGSAKASPSAS